jgi:hypothetical protein
MNFRDAKGSWKPIDDTLVADGMWFRNRADRYTVALPARLDRPIRFRDGNVSLAFAPLTASPVAADVIGSRAAYRSAWPGVDAVYETSPGRLKESLVLARAAVPARFSFTMQLSPALTPHLLRSGAIALRDRSGHDRLTFASPFMADAAGAVSRNVRYALHAGAADGAWTLVLSPSREWLESSARHFPVTIDPTVSTVPDLNCALIGDPTSGTDQGSTCEPSGGVDIGHESTPGDGYEYRLLHYWNLNPLPAHSRIDSATLRLRSGDSNLESTDAYHAYPLTRSFTDGATWTSADGTHAWTAGGGDYAAADGVAGTISDQDVVFDLQPIMQRWLDGTRPNDGLVVTGDSERKNFGSIETEQHRPSLDVVYRPDIGVRDTDAFDSFDVAPGALLRVNLATGNLVLQTVDFPGFQVPMGGDEANPDSLSAATASLSASRFWNSFDAADGAFGSAGRLGSGVDVRLRVDPDGNRILSAPSGYTVLFTKLDTGDFSAPADYPAALAVHPDGTATVTLPSGDKLEFSGWNAGAGGFLTRWSNAQDMASDYASSAGANDFVLDTADALTSFTSTGTGTPRVTTANTPNGQLTYAYTNGRLSSVTGPSGTTSYGYTGALLTSIDAPTGSDWTVEYAADDGRVSKVIEHPASAPTVTTEYIFTTDTTVATYPDGVVTYHLDPTMTTIERADSGASPPAVTLSGALAAAKPSLSASSSYDLDLSITDADGIKDVAVMVDGEVAAAAATPCAASPCSLSNFFIFDTSAYRAGIHNVEVFARDANGAQRVERFWVTVPRELFDDPVPEPVVDPSSETEIQDAKTFREDFGLDASDAHVRAVQANPAYAHSVAAHSVYLTPAEETYMNDRRRVEDATPLIDSYGRLYPDEYSDLYIDASGTVHVGFTANVAQHRTDLESLFPFPAQLEVHATQYSRDELARIADNVQQDLDDLDTQGIHVVTITERYEENDVNVGIEDLTSAKASYLESHYGPGVTVSERFGAIGTSSRSTPQKPLLPGLEIHNINGAVPGYNYCTLAWAAIGDIPPVVHLQRRKKETGGQRTPFYFTAGHCSYDTTLSSWKQGGKLNDDKTQFEGGRTFGATYAVSFSSGGFSDAMLISLSSFTDLNTYIWGSVYRDSNNKRYTQQVGGVLPDSGDDKGKEVCFSGATSLVKCGKVVNVRNRARLNVATRDGGKRVVVLNGLRQMDTWCAPGDSGSPVYVEEKDKKLVNAIGIISAALQLTKDATSGPCLFTHIDHDLNDLGPGADIDNLHLVLAQGGDGDMRLNP